MYKSAPTKSDLLSFLRTVQLSQVEDSANETAKAPADEKPTGNPLDLLFSKVKEEKNERLGVSPSKPASKECTSRCAAFYRCAYIEVRVCVLAVYIFHTASLTCRCFLVGNRPFQELRCCI